jgi:putative ABC transport system ATP-binding protein
MEPIIKIKDLNVIYFLGKSNQVDALRDVNLEIYPGEFIIFFGPSGCGKSTLLYAIAGLETNIHGDIFIEEHNLANLKPKEIETIHKTKIGMVFQAFYLISSLSILNNVILPQIFINQKREERKKKGLELLDYLGIKPQAGKLPSELSGGQQQRVAICRSLINDPAILLADEPVGNLDSVSAEDVMNLLLNLNEEKKKTVILVTHNPAHLHYAHKVFYMKDGKVIDTKINRKMGESLQPEKSKTEAATLSKELELLARTYSSITASGVGNLLIPFKAKQIVSEILIDMTVEEVEKIEKRVEKLLISGINDSEETFKYFDDDIEKGGLGMDRRKAEKLVAKIKSIIKEIKILEEDDKKILSQGESAESEEVAEVRHYLLEFFDTQISGFAALNNFNKAIKERLENKIDKESFRKKLDLPVEQEGVGLDKRSAKKMARKFELLILGKYK